MSCTLPMLIYLIQSLGMSNKKNILLLNEHFTFAYLRCNGGGQGVLRFKSIMSGY